MALRSGNGWIGSWLSGRMVENPVNRFVAVVMVFSYCISVRMFLSCIAGIRLLVCTEIIYRLNNGF